MRIIFMGTPQFAVPCLQALIAAGHTVPAVFCQPDKPQGRKMQLTPPPVKVCAQEHNIPVHQPATLRNEEAINLLRELAPELIVVVAYGKILPQAVLDIPPHGCINVHASLLPKYRGAGPIQWAVLNGERETGITTQQMDAGIDTGDILEMDKCAIADDITASELHDGLSTLGAGTLMRTLAALQQGTLTRTPQDHTQATHAPMLSREMSPLDFSQPAQQVHNQVRGLNPWPSATMLFEETQLKVHRTRTCETGDSPLHILCGDGKYIELLQVQQPGKKAMTGEDFLRGRR
ncbi:MAG: methionyl-tRNA formyltransferase [Oscillospiraceae bacterium]|nr:methionyl-tRNA formyltransferase [Oscillospiraceae bacterium]